MRLLRAAIFATFAGAVCAGQDAPEFRYRAAIDAPPGSPHYRVVLPDSVYTGVQQRALGDLRVLNALGEEVPYAFLPRQATEAAPVRRAAVKLFPLYGLEADGVEGVKLDVRRSAGGTVIHLAQAPGAAKAGRKLLGYLAQVEKTERPLEALAFDWRSAGGFSGAARVEASDDLLHWRTVVREAPVLMLEHDGERLERKRVELQGVKARYLRVSFSRVPADFALRGLQIELQGERPEIERSWRRSRRPASQANTGSTAMGASRSTGCVCSSRRRTRWRAYSCWYAIATTHAGE
jgi:Protein of unknown function (DUF3999)